MALAVFYLLQALLQFLELFTGSSQHSLWVGRNRHGFGQWFMGTGFPYMFASAVFRMTRPPFFVGGLGMLVGYLRSAFRRERRYEDLSFRKFLRTYQMHCLLRGKSRATADFNKAGASVWNPPVSEPHDESRVAA